MKYKLNDETKIMAADYCLYMHLTNNNKKFILFYCSYHDTKYFETGRWVVTQYIYIVRERRGNFIYIFPFKRNAMYIFGRMRCILNMYASCPGEFITLNQLI